MSRQRSPVEESEWLIKAYLWFCIAVLCAPGAAVLLWLPYAWITGK
jgi:hypothetical protein